VPRPRKQPKAKYTADRNIPGAFEGETVTRRRFMTGSAHTAGAVAAGAFTLPALGFALGPVFQTHRAHWVDVGAPADFAEQQSVSLTGAPTGGTFRLAFNGAKSRNIAFKATAAAVQAALLSMDTIPAGTTVAGAAGGPWTVSFGSLAPQNPLALASSALTGGTSPRVAITRIPSDTYVPKVVTLTAGIGEAGKSTVYMRRRNPSIDTEPADRYNQVIALSTRCMHMGCPVRYVSASERFICPCHGGVYDFRGIRTGGPPVRPLDRFYTRLRGGRVELGPRYSVNGELRRFSPRDPGEPLDGIGQYLYPSRPTARKLKDS
jgi:Rieske Fe-S protein